MRFGTSKRLGATAALLAAAMLTAACDSTPAPKAAGATQGGKTLGEFGVIGMEGDPGTPVEGGTLTFADVSEARSLDPTKTYATGASGGTPMAAVYDVLMRYDEEAGEFEPWLAEALEPSDDFTSWTLHLREGVRFSDGTPLDAEAVVGSLKYFMDNGGSDAPLLEANLSSFEATDDRTVDFRLNKPWSTFPNMLAQGAGMIVAPAALKGSEFTPIGAGPYKLEEYAPGEELVLSANSDYWKGEPHLDRLRFVVLPSPDASLESLKNGSVDATILLYAKQQEEALEAGFPGFRVLTHIQPVLWINQREGRPGADLRVRKAIALATDPEQYRQRVDAGQGIYGKGIFTPDSRWNTDVKPPAVNIEEAKRLVEEAKADGFDGKITYLDDADPRSRNEALVVKAMLEQVGFSVDTALIRSVADKMQKLYVERDFDLATAALSMGEADPFHRLYAGLSSESLLNLTGYTNADMDRLLAELQGAGSMEEQRAVIGQIEQLWHETVPGVNLGASAYFIPWGKNVHGVVPAAEYMTLFGEAWISK